MEKTHVSGQFLPIPHCYNLANEMHFPFAEARIRITEKEIA